MNTVHIANGDQAPASLGALREAVTRSVVTTREPVGVEVFEMSWGALTAVPGVDLVIREDDGAEYPLKRDIFASTYQEVAPGRFRKTTRLRLVQCPEGVVAHLKTEEGDIRVQHPDY